MTSILIDTFTSAFKLAIPAVLVFMVLKILASKRSDAIIKKLNLLTHDAETLSEKLRLKKLWIMTADTSNAVKIGKIKGYCKIGRHIMKDGEKVLGKDGQPIKEYFSIFLVRINFFGDKALYCVPYGKHTALNGDVTLKHWNFIYEDNMFVENDTPTMKSDEVRAFDKIGVDTIGKMSPTVHSAMMLDSDYRKQMRMGRLMKEPTEPERN